MKIKTILLLLLILSGASESVIAAPFAYVLSRNSFYGYSDVNVIDLATKVKVATLNLSVYAVQGENGPHNFTTDDSRIVVTSKGFGYISLNDSLAIIDTNTNTISISAIQIDNPSLMALSADENKLYVKSSCGIAVIDTALQILSNYICMADDIKALTASRDGTRVYTANKNNSVSVIETSTNSVLANIPVGLDPVDIAVNRSGSRVFVINRASNTMSVINTVKTQVISTINLLKRLVTWPQHPRRLLATPNGSRLYVTYDDSAFDIRSSLNGKLIRRVSDDTLRFGYASTGGIAIAKPGQTLVTLTETSGAFNDTKLLIMNAANGKLLAGIDIAAGAGADIGDIAILD